jgi:hypothetical protein
MSDVVLVPTQDKGPLESNQRPLTRHLVHKLSVLPQEHGDSPGGEAAGLTTPGDQNY